MRLAEHVAHTVHVDEMLDDMTVDEFDEWCAKDLIEPIGFHVQVLGMLTYLVQNFMGGDSEAARNAFTPWVKYAPPPPPDNERARRELDKVAGRPPDAYSG